MRTYHTNTFAVNTSSTMSGEMFIGLDDKTYTLTYERLAEAFLTVEGKRYRVLQQKMLEGTVEVRVEHEGEEETLVLERHDVAEILSQRIRNQLIDFAEQSDALDVLQFEEECLIQWSDGNADFPNVR